MSYAAIVNMHVHGSPEPVNDVSGSYISHRYRGDYTTLSSNKPAVGDDWNGLEVRRVTGPTKLANTSSAEMVVDAATPDTTPSVLGSSEVSNNEFPFYEIDWVAAEKSLRVHPAWSEMSPAQWQAIDLWIAETDSENRKIFKYWKRDKDGNTTGTIQTLGTANSPTKNEQDFAGLYLKGIEAYTDYLPVARKVNLYKGTSKPAPGVDIGAKVVGVPFSGVPTGFQWVKTGEGARKQGREFYWTKTEEWTGARKVLVDIDTIY